MKPIIKQPSEQLIKDFVFDIAPDTLASVDSVSVRAKGLVVEVAMLTAVAGALAAQSVPITIAAGTDGEIYAVSVDVTTSSGEQRTIDADVHVIDFDFAVPDASGSAYITPQEFIERKGLDEAIALSDAEGRGRIDAARLHAHLFDASAIIDTYLAKRYIVPLVTVPEVIKSYAADLAHFSLHVNEAPDLVIVRHKNALRGLEYLSKGMTEIPSQQVSASGAGAPEMVAPERTFNPNSLKGF